MGSVYAVMAGDCGDYVSVWRHYDDAYAAAGEAGAMDPETCYGVEEIVEEELAEFWFHHPGLGLASSILPDG